MRVIIKNIYWLWARLTYRIKINGKENIPKEGAVLICPNHIHALDSTFIMASAKRKINVLAKDNLFKSFIGRWFAKTFGIYSVKQNSADIDAIKTSLRILKNKELLMIFPEGTRNGMEKGLPIKNGPILIAIKSNTPIIPVGIKGTFKIFSKVEINIGKPIYYNEYKEQTKDKAIINELTQNLMEEIVKLRDKNIF